MQLFYKHSYFSDESMLKIWPEDKSVPMSWKLSSGSGGRFSSLVFSMFFFLSYIFSCKQLQNSSYYDTSYSALSPTKAGFTKMQIILEKIKSILL